MLVITVTYQIIVLPSSFEFSTLGALEINGSSATGYCSDISLNYDGYSTCSTPTSSVLMDGNIPTLTALDGDTWASQLMTTGPQIVYNYYFYSMGWSSINFNFSETPDYTGVRRVEVVIFNCRMWGMSAYFEISGLGSGSIVPSISSCNSLLKICIPLNTASREISFDFFYINYRWVHIAEITFYNDSSPCPPFTTIPGNSEVPIIEGMLFK